MCAERRHEEVPWNGPGLRAYCRSGCCHVSPHWQAGAGRHTSRWAQVDMPWHARARMQRPRPPPISLALPHTSALPGSTRLALPAPAHSTPTPRAWPQAYSCQQASPRGALLRHFPYRSSIKDSVPTHAHARAPFCARTRLLASHWPPAPQAPSSTGQRRT